MSYERSNRVAQTRNRWIRWSILGVVLVGMTAITYAHQNVNGFGKPVTVDALCPFGGLESLYGFISGAGFIEKTAISSLLLLFGSVGIALVMRRSFCGQICPLGALQGIFGALGGKLFKRRPQVPEAIDRPARWLKYVILVFFALWTWQAAALVIRPYDPWAAWAHISSAELLAEFGIGVAVLGVSLVGSLVYERFFCKYLCPMGAFLGIFSKVSMLGIRRDADACISCGVCDKACPMNVPVATADTVTSSECISCNECVNSCPVSGALEVSRGSRRLTPALATGVTVGALALVIVVTTAAGTFDWRMPTLAEAIDQSPTAAADGFDVAAIKGYMSMREIAAATGIPESSFVERWAVPEGDLGQPMKDIKDTYGFSPDDVRVWVGEQLPAQ
ncbi:MAG TPA: 4Fe-4S binding protein [Coriobacteriia bacterium]|nr:4Fe-4S binding protein [Coriobacteriia bacterium]